MDFYNFFQKRGSWNFDDKTFGENENFDTRNPTWYWFVKIAKTNIFVLTAYRMGTLTPTNIFNNLFNKMFIQYYNKREYIKAKSKGEKHKKIWKQILLLPEKMKLVIILGFAGTTNFGVRFCTNFILHKILDIFLHTCVSTRKTNLITHFYTVFFPTRNNRQFFTSIFSPWKIQLILH